MLLPHHRSLALFTLIATTFAACSNDSSNPAAADASAPSSNTNADAGPMASGDSGSPSGGGAGGSGSGADSGSNPSGADSGSNDGGQGGGSNTGLPWDDLTRTTSFDFQGETDASAIPPLVAGRYGLACYKSFDTNVPVGYAVLDFLESDGNTIAIEDLDGNVLNSVPWDGEGSLQFDTLLIVGVNANPNTIGVTLDSTNGNITVTSATEGGNAECDNFYKEVGLPVPLAVFEQVAGEYSATRNAEMADITINDDGTFTYQVSGQDAIDKEWDGNDDWVRTLAFPNYVGAPSLPRDNTGVFELVIDGTSFGSQETVKFMFDYRIETQPLLSFQFQGGNQFKTNDNLEEPTPELIDGLPDFFSTFAGTHQALVSARIDGLNGPYADLPASFENGEIVEFTVSTDGSIEVGGVTFEWDDSADQWMANGAVSFLSVGDTQSFVQLNVDTDYRDGFEVQLRNVQFATDALEFTNFTFELPPN